MSPKLDEILNDGRLARLFTKEDRHCALQLWILQIKSEQSTETRVIYGRLLPYSFSSASWSSTDDDNFQIIRQYKVQVIRLNLYLESIHCAELLRQLSDGVNISAISEDFKFKLSDKLKERFGTTALTAGELAYRPVAYQFNRDAHDERSPSSPHAGAGAFSASITQTNKGVLFRLDQNYDVALTKLVVHHLNSDTGLDFGGADTTRFGDLELLVFPALDDLERDLLSVSWSDATPALIVRYNPIQVPHFNGFQFRLNIENDRQIIYSSVAKARRNTEGLFNYKFELSNQLRTRTDSTEIDIFGYRGKKSNESTLCCRWRIFYIREFNLQSHMVGHGANPVKFDWLEKTTKPSASARVKTALTINRGRMGHISRIGGREADPWVPSNRSLTNLFARLYPPKSEGRFFLRWGQSDGEGRLQFVEWFRTLLAKYEQHQIVMFDPYFEDIGLGLLLLCAEPNFDCIVFRSLPKSPKQSNICSSETANPSTRGIDNLLANCEHNRILLRRMKLRIYGLKEGRLHDRYILIMGQDKLPVGGFNLSNSFQKAAENYPLLVTPIPADVLLMVEQYKSSLVQEAEIAQSEGEIDNPPMRLLFDSTTPPAAPRRYEPLRFLSHARAGSVLSGWTGEPSLKCLSGDPLKKQMVSLGLLANDSLALPKMACLRNYLGQQADNFAEFSSSWEVIGEVLAHSSTGDSRLQEFESEQGILEFLAQFLKTSFNRIYEQVETELALADHQLFQNSLEILLHSSYRPHHLFHSTKYTALTWSEYFAVRILWWYAPDALLEIAEVQMADVPMEPQSQDAVRLSLLGQIVSEISLSVQIEISEEHRDRLIRSGSGLLQWMGLNAIEMQLERPGGLLVVLQLVATFSYPERVRALGWMVQRAARDPNKAELYSSLVVALHEAMPATIPGSELRWLVDSMRGHMRQLVWAEPWLFRDVICPLLQNARANTDDACEIWIQELVTLLGPESEKQPRLFDRMREGQTTNISAFLFANSSTKRQLASLKPMKAILKRQQRIVQQPLASTSDWTRWDGALVISMWMLAFTRWCHYYLSRRSSTVRGLDELSQNARELTMIRPMSEWHSRSAGKQGELAAFLEQADKLLASDDLESKKSVDSGPS